MAQEQLKHALNRVAGTTNLDEQGAANVWAGTVGLELLGALNKKAGTVGLGFLKVLNLLAGTVNLDQNGAAAALSNVPTAKARLTSLSVSATY
jgi:hypothetical protein